MAKVRVQAFSISLDGFGTGEGLTDDEPFGHAGERLHEWMFAALDDAPQATQLDKDLVARFSDGIGAEIMGRRKFHVGSGPLPDDWEGFWGAEPPFHTPVLVLTHHPRAPLEIAGGTTFHFVDATPQEALATAVEAAGGLDVRLGGGTETVRAFLEADLVDELHLVLVPIVLGRGQRLWDGQEGLEERFDIEVLPGGSGVTHLLLTRRHTA
jgi:dihydrofolate reductase